MIFVSTYSRNMYLFFLMFIAVGLSLSKPLITLGELCLGALWLLEGNHIEKIKRFFTNKTALILCSVYLLTLLGLINTSNFDFAFDDIRRKLPLFVLPFLIVSFKPLTNKELRLIFSVYVGGVIIASLWSVFVMVGGLNEVIIDKRDLSRFNSHIRFGLEVSLAIFGALYYAVKTKDKKQKIKWVLSFVWLVSFLFLLNLITGIVVTAFTFLVLIFYYGIKNYKIIIKLSSVTVVIAIVLSIVLYIKSCHKEYLSFNDVEALPMQEYSPKGEKLFHDTISANSFRMENGNYIYRNIAIKEIEKAWNRRSKINFNGFDNKRQQIRFTILRFITSQGKLKTEKAINELTSEEIKAIENGISNFRYLDMNGIELRLHKIFWEMEMYNKYNVADGHSVMLRWVYWKTAFNIIQDNMLIGVGTGDVQDAFNEEHQQQNIISEKYWRRAHNQYITYFVTFGILGGLYFLFFLLYPIFALKQYQDYIYLCFISISMLSMLTEDTLETQVGITFFAYFNTLLIFKKRKNSF
ncbi:MAG: O-antigen ligase family protein [Flavobacteriales bacterium]|nr:O-antigen ligase family protein [Flavobacteriales bacterium]MCW8937215.1 O-antigen ligase family protein [Flavobacteriales bacterium]